MTPEERADEIMGRRIPECDCSSLAWHIRALIAVAVSEAVAEEREACAKTAESLVTASWRPIEEHGPNIAKAIRARGKV